MNKNISHTSILMWIGALLCGCYATTSQVNAQRQMPQTTQVAHTNITAAFTDPEFLATMRARTGNQVLYTDEVARITTLEIENQNIRSLAGLEHLMGLEQLVIADTSIVQLNLPTLPALQTLWVSWESSPAIALAPKFASASRAWCVYEHVTAIALAPNSARAAAA